MLVPAAFEVFRLSDHGAPGGTEVRPWEGCPDSRGRDGNGAAVESPWASVSPCSSPGELAQPPE